MPMSDYRLFGADTSPYSQKVRSFLRYKNVDFDWISRTRENEEEFQALAQVATVPLLISPERPASQDSTAILAGLEADHPEPSAVPDDVATSMLALILEDYADEWLNKIMFLERWGQKPDREDAALRVLTQLYGGKRPRAYKKARDQIADRMADRLKLVGAQAGNADILKASFERVSKLLDAHLKEHLYMFGGCPSAADFAMAAQYQQLLMDKSPAAWLAEHAPFVVAWVENMQDPKPGAPFASLADLAPTLIPLFAEELSRTYLVWAKANSKATERGDREVSAAVEGGTFEQSTQTYAARAYDSVRKAVGGALEDEALKSFLKDAGCNKFFG
ncbi:MAG: glutathione S-transferase family protein [Pseudomonadota bacterium]|nr:glutathione S-transferase family protein [Pseudomonadota bacterium]